MRVGYLDYSSISRACMHVLPLVLAMEQWQMPLS